MWAHYASRLGLCFSMSRYSLFHHQIRSFLTIYSEILKSLVIYEERSMAMIRILLSTKLGEMRLNQAELARMTGIRPSTINDLYHELADRVNLDHLDLICEALNCELSDIMIRKENAEVSVKNRAGTAQRRKK